MPLLSTFTPSTLRGLGAFIAAWSMAVSTLAAANGELAETQRLLQAHKAEDALRRIEQGLKALPDDVQWRFLKAVALADLNRPAEATRIYLKLIEERPELPEPRNNLAVLYAQQGQFDKARATLEAAMRTSPIYSAAYDNLGDVHARLASLSYAKALQITMPASTPPAELTAVREIGAPATAPLLMAQATVKPPVAPPAAAKPASAAVAAASVPKPAASAAAAVVAAASAPAAAASKPGSASVAQAAEQVRAAVQGWAAAWSRKDLDAYFAAYHPKFSGSAKSHAAWMEDRRVRILGKKQISVAVSGLVVEFNGDRARVQFRQNYRADALRLDSRKVLGLIRVGGHWLIDQETAGS